MAMILGDDPEPQFDGVNTTLGRNLPEGFNPFGSYLLVISPFDQTSTGASDYRPIFQYSDGAGETFKISAARTGGAFSAESVIVTAETGGLKMEAFNEDADPGGTYVVRVDYETELLRIRVNGSVWSEDDSEQMPSTTHDDFTIGAGVVANNELFAGLVPHAKHYPAGTLDSVLDAAEAALIAEYVTPIP